MEGDYPDVVCKVSRVISIHSLRMEGDTDATSFCKPLRHFNPLPPHGGRPGLYKTVRFQKSISIHSLRMEGDSFITALITLLVIISIHSLRMEGD